MPDARPAPPAGSIQQAADAREPARQGGGRRFLDVLLHQLPARDAVRERLVPPLQGFGTGDLGVHSPEFAFEKDTANVRAAVKKFDIQYPVALDSDMAIWKAFNNKFWPAHYFVDAQGADPRTSFRRRQVRPLRAHDPPAAHRGRREESARSARRCGGRGRVGAPADTANVASPETYLGYERAENFVSPGSFARDAKKTYAIPKALTLNQWALGGRWQVGDESTRGSRRAGPHRIPLQGARPAPGAGSGARPASRCASACTLDGEAAEAGCTAWTSTRTATARCASTGCTSSSARRAPVEEQEFIIEFLDPGVDAYSFTFG